MPCLERLVFNLLRVGQASPSLRRPRSSLRSLYSSFVRSRTPTRWPAGPSCHSAFSTMADSRNDLFEYTSGRWIFNDALRHSERRRVFNVDGLRRLAAHSVGRSPDDIVNLAKLAEGGFNRLFLLTMRDGFQMVARIPYPFMSPKYYAVASEVATMSFLRSSGLPVPKVYGYSPSPDNEAETEYIFMEFISGTKLTDVWKELGEQELSSVLHQLVQLESKMMSIEFPAGGSLYYPRDLENGRGKGVPLAEDGRFCVGPDVRIPMWFGRRSQLDIDRGPYSNAESVLVKAAHKELAYMEQFGQPLLPFQRMRREAYQYQAQSPSDHIENLRRYLLIAPSLVPGKDPTPCQFRIRHPDLQPNNIIVSRSSGPESNEWQVISLLDWQHTSILPLFLSAGIPHRIQNYDDPAWHHMIPPLLPENLDELNELEQKRAKSLYHRRLVHYLYVKSTAEHNKLHHSALNYPSDVLRRRLFTYASEPWEGETLSLKLALIEAAGQDWKLLTATGRVLLDASAGCPVVFDAEDVRETMKLEEDQREADDLMDMFQNKVGLGPDGWVPVDRYDEAVAVCKKAKEDTLKADLTLEERAEIVAHWPFDDMDEGKYM